MDTTVKNYLKEILHEDAELFFILTRIYVTADFSLIENFSQYLNNKFMNFLKLVLFDKGFQLRLNLDKLEYISKLLLNLIEYKNNYIVNFLNSDLWKHYEKNIPLTKPYNDITLLINKIHYDKTNWLYKLNINPNLLDKKLILGIVTRIQLLIEDYKISEYFLDQNQLLLNIIHDDYKNDFNSILAMYNGHNPVIFHTLVCDNNFLDICLNYLSKINLSEVVINNIIDILKVGIAFKTLDYKIDLNFAYHYKQINKQKLKTFNYQKAKFLINLMQRKKYLVSTKIKKRK